MRTPLWSLLRALFQALLRGHRVLLDPVPSVFSSLL
jgi:hypothetical protein